MTPASRDHTLSNTQSCGWRCRQPPHPGAGFSRAAGGGSTGEGFIDLTWRSAPGRSSASPGWWDPGAPNLPKPYTACVHRAPGGSGWRIARLAATAPAPGWPAGWSICRKTAGLGLFLDAPVRWNTVMFNQPSWWQQGNGRRRWLSASPGAGDRWPGRWRSAGAHSLAVTSRRCCWRAVWRPTRCCCR